MATPEACRQSNLSQMLTRTGYDVVIVCTSNETQAAYWQVRLAGGSVVPANCTVLAVDEDWEGGAGARRRPLLSPRRARRRDAVLL